MYLGEILQVCKLTQQDKDDGKEWGEVIEHERERVAELLVLEDFYKRERNSDKGELERYMALSFLMQSTDLKKLEKHHERWRWIRKVDGTGMKPNHLVAMFNKSIGELKQDHNPNVKWR